MVLKLLQRDCSSWDCCLLVFREEKKKKKGQKMKSLEFKGLGLSLSNLPPRPQTHTYVPYQQVDATSSSRYLQSLLGLNKL